MFVKILVTILANATISAFASPAPTPVNAPLAKRINHAGEGTVYAQDNQPGSCGNVNPDSALIGALSNFWMDNESPNTSICGRQIVVTNTGSNDGVGGEGNVVTVTVADTCPSCDENHIDLSESAWKKLTNNAPDGTVLVDWHFT